MSDSCRAQLLGVTILMMLLPIPFVLLRFKTRRQLCHLNFSLSDWILLAALLTNITTCIATIIGATLGDLGSRDNSNPDGLPDITRTHLTTFKTLYLLQVLLTLGIGLTKISVLLLYRQIFVHPHFRVVNTIWLAIIIGWTLAFSLVIAFQCTPVHVFWTEPLSFLSPGYCININSLYLALAVTDLLTDAMVLASPIPLVYRLRMPLKQRINVILIFLMGGFVLAFGVIRLIYFVKGFVIIGDPSIIPYVVTEPLSWSIAETSTGIICACLPTLAPQLQTGLRGSLANYIVSSTLWSIISQRIQTGSRSAALTRNGPESFTVSKDSSTSHPEPERWVHTEGITNAICCAESDGRGPETGLSDLSDAQITVKHDVHIERL